MLRRMRDLDRRRNCACSMTRPGLVMEDARRRGTRAALLTSSPQQQRRHRAVDAARESADHVPARRRQHRARGPPPPPVACGPGRPPCAVKAWLTGSDAARSAAHLSPQDWLRPLSLKAAAPTLLQPGARATQLMQQGRVHDRRRPNRACEFGGGRG